MDVRFADPTVLDGGAISALPWRVFHAIGVGVEHKVLWESGDSMAGVMRIAAGGQVDEHVHRLAHHHLWVTEGTVQLLGRSLGPGSYAHVPAGVAHRLVNGGDGPATFLYLYLQPQV